MTDSLDLAITGVGAVSPVGLSAPATCAALRAGLARLSEVHTCRVDGEIVGDEPVIGGRAPTEWFHGGPQEVEWPGHEQFAVAVPPSPDTVVASGAPRLAELAMPAAREAWSHAGRDETPPDRWGIWLGVDPTDKTQAPMEELASLTPAPPLVTHIESGGRAAALSALRVAAKAIRADEVEVALVGGVDSLLRRERIAALAEAGEVRSASHPQGVLPGEAAAFIVLERTSQAKSRDAVRATISGVSREDEPTVGTEDPNQAYALTRVVRRVLQPLAGSENGALTICDLNGDRYRATEWTMAELRAFARLPGDKPIWHHADCTGDPGAASGALDLVWAVSAFAKDYAGNDTALVWGASDGPLRAAALLHAPASNGGK